MPSSATSRTIQDILNRSDWRQQLVSDYGATADRLTSAYQRILPMLQDSVDGLTSRLKQWAKDHPEANLSAEDARGFKQYQDLLTRVEIEMKDFAAIVRNEAGTLQDQAVSTGIGGALEMAQSFSGSRAEIVGQAWNQPAPETLQQVISYVDSSVFREKAGAFGSNAANNAGDVILSAIAMGKNPEATARILSNWLMVPMVWAENSVRTIQMYSYRSANHASYLANPDVVQSWMWWATIGDPNTCMSCIEQHGTIHPLDEELDDHYRGRCTPLPIIVGSTWQNSVETGQDWFDGLSEGQQRAQMGNNAMYDAFKAGKVEWGDFSQVHHDDLFGDMVSQASLKSILGDNAKEFYGNQANL